MIADDHPVVRDALRLLIGSRWGHFAIDDAASLSEVEGLVRRRTDYGLVVLDLMLPDSHGFSGLLLIKKLLETTPVVLISSKDDVQTVASAHILGASGFVSKSTSLTEMGRVFERALAGETTFPAAKKSDTAQERDLRDANRRLSNLSTAQLRVLLALAKGGYNKQIAGEMQVTEATIKAHLTAIFRKLGVQNRTQAILAARSLIQDGS